MAGACGSTVDSADRPDASSLDASGEPTSATDAEIAADVVAGGELPAGASPSAREPATRRTSAAPGSAAASIRTGRGVTDAAVKIGLFRGKNNDESLATLAVKEASYGDQKVLSEAIVGWINSNGGVAGRKIELVVYEEDAEADEAAEEQAACARFTDDARVFAVIGAQANFSPSFAACLANKGTPFVFFSAYPYDKHLFAKYDSFLYAPENMNMHRQLRLMIDGLAELGYFAKGSRVGAIYRESDFEHRAVDEALKPALARAGVRVEAEAYLSGEASEASAQAGAAVLRFRSLNIDHVLIYEAGGALYFITAASGQGYFPRYGLGAQNYLAALQKTLPAQSLRGAVATGVYSYWDTDGAHQHPPNATAKFCTELARKAGHPDFPSRISEGFAVVWCDLFLYLKRALDKAPELTPAGLKSAVETMGSDMQPGLNFAFFSGPGRHDANVGWRPLYFDDGCDCFNFRGDVRRLPAQY